MTRRSRVTDGRSNRAARRAAIEKRITGYIYLSCGHYTDGDRVIENRAFRPKRGVEWCEKCAKWVPRAKVASKYLEPNNDTLF